MLPSSLSEEQVYLIAWWIEQGAPGEVLIVDLNPAADILLTASNYLGLSSDSNRLVSVEATTDDELSYARSLGFLIRDTSMDSNLLEVDISVQGGDLAQEHIQALNALAPQM